MFGAFKKFGRMGGALGAAGAKLPAGAIGVWYADQYVATPKRMIPNAATSTATTVNLLSAPKRLFQRATFWDGSGKTVVDDAAAAEDGTTTATTVSLSANGYLKCVAMTVTAGTYTLVIKIKRGGGADVNFRMGVDFGSTSVKTATSSFQRIAQSFTVTAGSKEFIPLWTETAGTTGSYIVESVELFSGASDPGEQPAFAGHMPLGVSHFDSRPSVSGGVLDLTAAGSFGVVQFPSDITLSAYTVIAVASKTATGSDYQGILSKIQNYQNWTAYFEQNSSTGIAPYIDQVSGNLHTGRGTGPGLWLLRDRGFHVICHRYTGTVASAFVDDTLIAKTTITRTAPTVRDLFAGVVNSASFYSGYKVSSIAIYDKALSDAEVATVYKVLSARSAVSGNAITPPSRLLFCEGDSITAWNSSGSSYARKYGANASPLVYGGIWANGGARLQNNAGNSMVERLPDLLVSVAAAVAAGKTVICSALIGANDFATIGASYAASLKSLWVDPIRAIGAKVVICTVLPRSDGALTAGEIAAFNTNRALFNTAIKATGYCDAVVDFAADATMGPDGASSNATYYADGLHPSNAGHNILEPIYRAVINAL